MRTTLIIALLLLMFSEKLFAQKPVYLTITHKLGDLPFSFNMPVVNDLGHSYELTRVDYYISGIQIIHDGGQVIAIDTNKHLLIKANSHSVNYLGVHDLENIEGIVFSIGVHPSLNNEDPALQDAGSPLYFQNPTMHWGWASGYFFACLEGKCGTTLPLSFQLHGLWNQNYFEQSIPLSGVESLDGSMYIHLDADYNEALRNVNLNACPTQHGTNQEDLKVLENFRDFVFSAGDGSLLGVDKLIPNPEILCFPNPAKELVHIRVNNLVDTAISVNLVDVLGREILTKTLTTEFGSISLESVPAGVYFLQIVLSGKLIESRKLVKE